MHGKDVRAQGHEQADYRCVIESHVRSILSSSVYHEGSGAGFLCFVGKPLKLAQDEPLKGFSSKRGQVYAPTEQASTALTGNEKVGLRGSAFGVYVHI